VSGNLSAWVSLNAALSLGPLTFHRVLRAYGSPEAALARRPAQWSREIAGMGQDTAEKILEEALSFDAARELAECERLKIRLLTLANRDYPAGLLQAADAAPLLYVQGALPAFERRLVAVVGSRKPSAYGQAQCQRLVAGLVARGAVVVSGLARGIDAKAHEEALAKGGCTLAVLGSGLLDIYPGEHQALAADIAASGGALLSQFPLRAAPDKRRFPARNSVIAAISSGVLVVEGRRDSGSLITARLSIEHGRDVFAVPGPLGSELSEGPNRLIQKGAKLVTRAEDILMEYPEYAALRRSSAFAAGAASASEPSLPGLQPSLELNGEESLLIQSLRQSGQVSLDQLALSLGLAAARVGALVTLLEIKGALRQLPGSRVEAL